MGLSTRVFTTDTFPVPNEWVFENFLNLNEKLEGQSVSIKSVFNKKDSDPSMIIYLHNNGKYKFNDYSAGIKGDAVDFIQAYYNLPTRQDAFRKVYYLWKEGDYDTIETRALVKITTEISEAKVRDWNMNDAKYWMSYHIGSKELEAHNIKPLESYTFKKTQGDKVTHLKFDRPYCYGYYRKDGTLYKIYNPKVKKSKFIKVVKYIQGHDQLNFNGKWLIILASLKDLMAFKKLNFPNVECIAPDSENTMLTPKQIKYYRKRYRFISTLFDNDAAGKKASRKYEQEYGIPYTEFDIEKDIADCVKQHGVKNSKIFLKPHLLETYARKNNKITRQ